ncbi:unnamed protein product [Ilex paraguariensis]|uniref:Uncharacterized protein n=1 Tax=Ilex paraguariensis TaxID=185542 RepID=A0ABC8RWF9_9AQUA
MSPSVTWGRRKCMRCAKVDLNGEITTIERHSSVSLVENGLIGRLRSSEPKIRTYSFDLSPAPKDVGRKYGSGQDGLEAVRGKLMSDLRNEADKMKDAIKKVKFVVEPPVAVVAAEADTVRPWNLRKRRAARTSPNDGEVSPAENREKAQFSLSLSRREIEEDLMMMMMGHKPSQRPKRRPNSVQTKVDHAFPGLWLKEIDAKSLQSS